MSARHGELAFTAFAGTKILRLLYQNEGFPFAHSARPANVIKGVLCVSGRVSLPEGKCGSCQRHAEIFALAGRFDAEVPLSRRGARQNVALSVSQTAAQDQSAVNATGWHVRTSALCTSCCQENNSSMSSAPGCSATHTRASSTTAGSTIVTIQQLAAETGLTNFGERAAQMQTCHRPFSLPKLRARGRDLEV